ncbi:MAG: pentapeptide repeat-containing protein [Synechococcaceae cyanobacterium]|nr:pentapeptide repeat-containing protein [Synechococcaceae cyanobacterium]
MTAQHRLLIAALLTLLFALLPWPPAAALAALLTLLQAGQLLLPSLQRLLQSWRQPLVLPLWLTVLITALALVVFLSNSGLAGAWGRELWRQLELRGSLLSDLSQVAIALLALMVTLRQFSVERVIFKELNLITQAQLVDNFIQGVSEMISDGDGFLEDWPLERMLAEGRLAALLATVDPATRARLLRFLSHSNLLTPLQRDQRVGRPMLDGQGMYLVDRATGTPVVQLRQLLIGADLAGTDLSGVDFNGADLSGSDLSGTNLRGANLAATNLTGTNLEGSNLQGVRFFYGSIDTVSPAHGEEAMELESGRGTGAILRRTRLAGSHHLAPEQRAYLERWKGGEFRS